MAVWIRFPGGLSDESSLIVCTGAGVQSGTGRLNLFFSPQFQPILADFLEVPEVEGLEVQELSETGGLVFQLQFREKSVRKPEGVSLSIFGSGFREGSFSPGLLDGNWIFFIPGPLPASGFRVTVEVV